MLFGKFIGLFNETFSKLESSFVNLIVVSLDYKRFDHDMPIARYKFSAQECYFIVKGGVAVCETSCYSEPINVYGPGAFILVYQLLLEAPLDLDYIAVSADSLVEHND